MPHNNKQEECCEKCKCINLTKDHQFVRGAHSCDNRFCPCHGLQPPKQGEEKIEKAYPEAYRLARKFHELYEEVAPKFGYKTKDDTKEFDPNSPNGRTMAYVCKTIVDEEIESHQDIAYQKGREDVVREIEKILLEKKKEASLENHHCTRYGEDCNCGKWHGYCDYEMEHGIEGEGMVDVDAVLEIVRGKIGDN